MFVEKYLDVYITICKGIHVKYTNYFLAFISASSFWQ